MSISKFNIVRHDIIECKFCHKQIKSLGISTHLLVKHNIHSREYYDKYLKEPDENICKNCGKETKFINFTYGYRRYCCTLCARQSEEAKLSASETWHSHTDEWKQDVRLRTQNTYFQRTGYYHNWSNPDSRQKCIDTYFKETGYTHNMKNPEHLKQRSEEYFRKTGYYHNWSNPESFAKCQQTYYEKLVIKIPVKIQIHNHIQYMVFIIMIYISILTGNMNYMKHYSPVRMCLNIIQKLRLLILKKNKNINISQILL